jgi:hypothetical protein
MSHYMVLNACSISVKYHNSRDNIMNDAYFYILIEQVSIMVNTDLYSQVVHT